MTKMEIAMMIITDSKIVLLNIIIYSFSKLKVIIIYLLRAQEHLYEIQYIGDGELVSRENIKLLRLCGMIQCHLYN